MEFQISTTSDITEIHLKGQLTFDDHDQFNEVKALADGRSGRKIVFDFSGLEFMDSAGLGMLFVFSDLAVRNNISVKVRGANGIVKKLMDLVHFEEIVSPSR